MTATQEKKAARHEIRQLVEQLDWQNRKTDDFEAIQITAEMIVKWCKVMTQGKK
jgi:hypothetical protein